MVMQSEDYKLADALKTALQSLLPGRTVELVGDPRADRKAMTELQILVRPAAWEQEASGRSTDTDYREVHVGVVSPCVATDLEGLDGCLAVCDQVRALWGANGALRDAVVSGHQMVGARKQVPIYNEQMLMQNNLFVGTITVRYVQQS